MPDQPDSAAPEFYFLSGNGNDFIALTSPHRQPTSEEVAGWCRRGISLGADGVLHLARVADGRVRLGYWNADGGRSDFCFNGTRAAAQLAGYLGWAEEGAVDLETDAGCFGAKILSDLEVEIDAPVPPGPQPIPLETLAPKGGKPEPALAGCDSFFLKVGVPHLVLVLPADSASRALEELEVEAIGRRLRHHSSFPEGANVNFVRYSAERSQMQLRTYERGVEAETLACGSGVVASAWVGLHQRRLDLPVAVATRGGFPMQLSGENGHLGLPSSWRLRGDARIVARGTLGEAALRA